MLYTIHFHIHFHTSLPLLRELTSGSTLVDARIPAEVIERLRDLGHEVEVVLDDPGVTHFGRVSAVSRDPGSGLLRAGSGPAWWTASAGL